MKPILFNTEMVGAILDGRKTVTRRVIKGSKKDWRLLDIENNPEVVYERKDSDDIIRTLKGLYATFEGDDGYYGYPMVKAPYQPGDILYVRETWSFDNYLDVFIYRTDYGTTEDDSFPPSMYKWRPSIHMPKQAARIFLRVTNVRVDRLQNITADECVREGIPQESLTEIGVEFTIGQFHDLWDSTIKKADLDRYGWTANPWVWVIEFERISEQEALL